MRVNTDLLLVQAQAGDTGCRAVVCRRDSSCRLGNRVIGGGDTLMGLSSEGRCSLCPTRASLSVTSITNGTLFTLHQHCQFNEKLLCQLSHNNWPKKQSHGRHTSVLLQSCKSPRWLIPMAQLLSLPCWIHCQWKVEVDLPIKSAGAERRKIIAQGEILLHSSTWKQPLPSQRQRSNTGAVNAEWQVIRGKHARFWVAMNYHHLQHLFDYFDLFY